MDVPNPPHPDRPEYVACIARTREDQKGRSVCGRYVVGWAFVGIDHAFNTVEQQDRLLICPECATVARRVLEGGTWNGKAENG
jgi:hypothetical protein